ncbi:MAG TPA: PIG-L family deacetylase [Thermoanaerobaculia bacterium]|nr:PIG-L family deacetylase [Thermoanaerobaculia bacterium]
MPKRQLLRAIALFAVLVAQSAVAAQKPLDGAELQLALKKLTVVGSALYVAAHPDDENTAMISWLASERLYRAGYLAMTRGDGGQNLIGDEKGELLGVIRTQELLAARRIDSGEQFFTRALDFGYSKTPAETMTIWGHDTILADVVWTIRRFQPDVIITRFPTTGEGGHGHHTASAILAVEAFTAAADATKFPEQLKYVNVWKPQRLFWNRFSFQPIKPDDPSVAKSLRIDLGAFNPLLGRAYTEIAAESRSQHKSQGFGSAERRGSVLNYFDLIAGDPAQKDLFEGLNTTWSRYPGGEKVGAILQQASDSFDPKNPSKTIPVLLQAWEAMDRLGASDAWSPRVNPWIEVKRGELLEAIRGCAGLAIDVSAGDSSAVPGAEIPVTVTVVNRSDYPFVLQAVASPYANPGIGVGKPLKNNEPIRTEIKIKVPADAEVSQPYWLRAPMTKGAFQVGDQRLIGLPSNPASIPIVVTLDDGLLHSLFFTVPAVFRWTDPVKGEQTRPVDVVPEVVANVKEKVLLFPDAKARTVEVALRSFAGATSATLRLTVPAGWKVEPAAVPIVFQSKGDEAKTQFTITPPAGASTGTARAEVELPGGKKVSTSLTEIDYPHIPAQRVFSEAVAKLVRLDIKKKGTKIGYIMGPGDDVPDALRQIGYEVALLSDSDLDQGDFAQYDAIVTGVRAYNTRKRLKADQPKLMQYVENGGTLVVQYNTTDQLAVSAQGPYPFKITRDRVTGEEAPVRFVRPKHPLLNTPNTIAAADFDGWVQERGLYFTGDADPRYDTILACNDPGESEKEGGELFARYGKGVFVYTSYAWFRQLPAGVPGAYKLFANLVSAGR